MRTFSPGELQLLAVSVLEGLGTPNDLAECTARSLVQANVLGHDSHGIIRLLQYAEWVRSGQIKPDARAAVQRLAGAVAVIDGAWGFGQPAAALATDTAIGLARRFGVGVVAISACNHIGRLGEYVEEMAGADGVGIALCNSGPIMAPAGGTRATFGTNPIAWAVPLAGAGPLVLDFSTAVVAEGKIRVALAEGKPLPYGLIIDRDGQPSTDPHDLYADGALLPFGGHKGSGLAMMIEIVGGLLSGMGVAPMPNYQGGNGTLFACIAIDRFVDPQEFRDDVAAFAERVVQARDGSRDPAVLVPGEVEQKSAERRRMDGIAVTADIRRDITRLARQLGVDLGSFAVDGADL